MKKIEKTTTIVTGYEANDGTFFTDMEECLKYEKSSKCAIRSAVKGKVNKYSMTGDMVYDLLPCSNDGETIYGYKVNSIDDVKLLNMVNYGGRVLTTEDIGKVYIVCHDAYENEYYVYNSIDEYKEKICNALDNLAK